MKSGNTNIILACRYPIIALGISHCIEANTGHQVTGRVASVTELLALINKKSKATIIVELELLKPSGLSAIKQIISQSPASNIIVISSSEKQPFISKCIDLGAMGYLSMMCQPEELLEAISIVSQGNKFLSKDVAYEFAMSNLGGDNELLERLTKREHQVMAYLAQGMSASDIAEQLCLSPKTVHVYRSNIFEKLGVSTLPDLTMLALRHGIVSLDTA